MKLLWLLAIPPWIFAFVAFLAWLIAFLQDGHEDSWWAMPAWVAVAFPVSIGGVVGIFALGALALGALP